MNRDTGEQHCADDNGETGTNDRDGQQAQGVGAWSIPRESTGPARLGHPSSRWEDRLVRVRSHRREYVTDIVVFLRDRGFLVVDRGSGELDVHRLNYVSARSDAQLTLEALAEWRLTRPDAPVEALE